LIRLGKFALCAQHGVILRRMLTRVERLRASETIGRPIGDDRFLVRLERFTGRILKPGNEGWSRLMTRERETKEFSALSL
jgi:hypothetical protein